MNYMKIYHDICNRGHERGTKKLKGFHLHHIIPACYFKSRKIASYKGRKLSEEHKQKIFEKHMYEVHCNNIDKLPFNLGEYESV